MKIVSRNKIGRLLGLGIALAMTGHYALAQSGDFVPAAYGPSSAGANAINSGLWDFVYTPAEIITAASSSSYTYLYKSSLYALGIAAKLGIGNVSLDASADFSTLHTLETWSQTATVKLTAYKGNNIVSGPKTGLAIVGAGVQSSAIVKGGSLKAALTSGSLGIEANVQIHSETLNVSALGYNNFVPFTLPIDNTTGLLKFNQIQVAINALFRDYQKANTAPNPPILLGFIVDKSLYMDGNKVRDFDTIKVERP